MRECPKCKKKTLICIMGNKVLVYQCINKNCNYIYRPLKDYEK